jgi:hypothetical protein
MEHWCVQPDPPAMRHVHPRDLRVHPIRHLHVKGKRQLVLAGLLQPMHHLQPCVTAAMRQLLQLQPFVCCQS